MKTTKEQIKAHLEAVRLVAEAIREAKWVPSGHLYAMLMGVMDADAYGRLIETLKRTGLVRETAGHVLEWAGPTESEERSQNSLL